MGDPAPLEAGFVGNPDAVLVPQSEGAWLELEAQERADRRRALFWEVLHRLADEYGVELLLSPKRSAARWARGTDPPLLLAATVRFERPGDVRPKRKRRKEWA